MSMNHQSERLETMIADGSGPILVTFHNGKCEDGICGTQNDYFDRTASDLRESSARFEHIDLDVSPELTAKYRIDTLPTAILFVDGKVETRLSGLTDPGVLACTVLAHVKEGAELMARSGNICPLPQVAA